MHVSPAEEGHWIGFTIGFTITTTVVLHRWHHLYFIVVVANRYNRLPCQTLFQSYSWQCLTRQFLHLSRKWDKAGRKFSEGSAREKGELSPLFFSFIAVLTHAYLGHLIWYKTLIKNFPPIASIRAQFHSRQVLPHHLVNIFFSCTNTSVELSKIQHNVFQSMVRISDSSCPWGEGVTSEVFRI